MSEKDKKASQISSNAAKDVAASEDLDVMNKYINELSGSMYFGENPNSDDLIKRLNACISMIQSIKPQDTLEAQLITQMISGHNIAMECLRRSNLPSQTFSGRETNLKHANKFMRLYIDQLNALNKHRGKGQQKVTVEYVNVEAGGQAIVGNVSTNNSKKNADKNTPRIKHKPPQTIDSVAKSGRQKETVNLNKNGEKA